MTTTDQPVTVTICTTCRAGQITAEDAPRPGQQLFDALSGHLPDGVQLRGAECLSACSRGCSMVLSGGPSRWTYVYGDLDTDAHLSDIVNGVTAYAQTSDGVVPWRERPVVFRKQSIARIPPQEPTE
ncbi:MULTISPECIES: DUF1636 family protein [Sulfitobacter]|jgi:predicted metal-binding protein|uniref:DUF1636 family protein n=1 Tax=Sulfitobacter TaxID=60136 RepID=UPI000C3F8D1B|nr:MULTISPECIES: DUF1636 domain-containing protein [Sulfitobacter]MAN09670.1 metal-binding protein [Roseobacter sp.]HBU53739.1 metal-binding protein [Sulfitobacter sp.]MAX75211.1 metal-binding protein [Roseobacter sp.]GLO79374.1 metal-binding protein [Sulfitobacter pontiacus]HAR82002.1 metal-binding protein [Sulfitobacter pontiacus]|tara:strand:+ start:552 stop:932 length:381 start_codon:yes stop_codon:yes gene_type:complete